MAKGSIGRSRMPDCKMVRKFPDYKMQSQLKTDDLSEGALATCHTCLGNES